MQICIVDARWGVLTDATRSIGFRDALHLGQADRMWDTDVLLSIKNWKQLFTIYELYKILQVFNLCV